MSQDPSLPPNPYATPLVSDAVVVDETTELLGMSFGQLKKLRNASHTIRSLAVLWVIGFIVLVIALVASIPDPSVSPYSNAFLLGWTSLVLIGIVGAFRRPTWGRVTGMLVCLGSLINVPMGTILGILGLVAYGRGGRLFGSDRLLHRDLEAAYRQAKKARKAAR